MSAARRLNPLGLVPIAMGLALGAVAVGAQSAWRGPLVGGSILALAALLVGAIRAPRSLAVGARSIAWSIVFLADRDARGETVNRAGRLTLAGVVVIVGLEAISHVAMSGNWMAQAGLSRGGPLP